MGGLAPSPGAPGPAGMAPAPPHGPLSNPISVYSPCSRLSQVNSVRQPWKFTPRRDYRLHGGKAPGNFPATLAAFSRIISCSVFLPDTFQKNGRTRPLSVQSKVPPSQARDPLPGKPGEAGRALGPAPEAESVWTWGTITKLQIVKSRGLSNKWVRACE